MPSGALSCSRSASPHVPADALRLLTPLAGLIHRQLPADGQRSEQSDARATYSLRRPQLQAVHGCPQYFEPTCGHLPPASARQRGFSRGGAVFYLFVAALEVRSGVSNPRPIALSPPNPYPESFSL